MDHMYSHIQLPGYKLRKVDSFIMQFPYIKGNLTKSLILERNCIFINVKLLYITVKVIGTYGIFFRVVAICQCSTPVYWGVNVFTQYLN